MIAVAVLVVGLLLVVASVAAARIPDEAVFVAPGSEFGWIRAGAPAADGTLGADAGAGTVRRVVAAFVLSPIHPATWYATGAVILGVPLAVFAFALLMSLFSAGSASLFIGVGVAVMAVGMEFARLVARRERWRASRADRRPLRPHEYRQLRGSLKDLLLAEFADRSRWQDVLYLVVNLPLAIVEFSVVVSLWAAALILVTFPTWAGPVPSAGVIAGTLVGVLLLPVAASASQVAMALHRAVVNGLLCTSENRELRQQVETLRESRSAVLDVEATELRRIERDLHDGAQQRLVRLTIDLSLAAEKIDSDPEGARRLVLESKEQARSALAELRDLVRGIAPAILLDRGLEAALQSLAGRSPIPTSVVSALPPGDRLPDAVERAAYFVVAEALANVAKHATAKRCEVRCRREGDRLAIEVWDDGAGGATIRPGGGLAGLVGRVEALDGHLVVTSPAGGPTMLRAVIPAAAWRPPWWIPATPVRAPAPTSTGPTSTVPAWYAPGASNARQTFGPPAGPPANPPQDPR